MKYASLTVVAVSVLLGALAIGCGSSRPHGGGDVDSGPGGSDMGVMSFVDMGGGPGNDASITPPRDANITPPRDANITRPNDTSSTRMCVGGCTSDSQCAGTCPAVAGGSSNCCMMGHCYISHTATCPAVGNDSAAGGCG